MCLSFYVNELDMVTITMNIIKIIYYIYLRISMDGTFLNKPTNFNLLGPKQFLHAFLISYWNLIRIRVRVSTHVSIHD